LIETPDVRRMRVFNNGRVKAFKGRILTGGQTPPIKIEGDRADEKNAQKNPKKSITSEAIKRIIPVRRSRPTERVLRAE
jgi:hypothetical protein